MRVACIGEGMIELRDRPGGGLDMGYGGDCLNTAIYMARLGVAVDFATALGDDRHSRWLLDAWGKEGVGTDTVLRVSGRMPGLYLVQNLPGGGREVDTWRGDAPARQLFTLPGGDALAETLSDYDLVYFTGMTLSLYDSDGLDALRRIAQAVRQRGGRVVFDANYRPRGWSDAATARAAVQSVLPLVDMALTGMADEQALFGDTHVGMAVRRLRDAAVGEVVVKMGSGGAMVSTPEGETAMLPARGVTPVDTTGAGDAFNAAYMAARIKDLPPRTAAGWGNTLAAAVIQHRGAIIPKSAMPRMGGP